MINQYLLIIIIIDMILLLPLIIYLTSNKIYKNRFYSSIYYSKNHLGYLISISGKIRTGKTSLMSGLSHIYQISIINDLHDLMDKIKLKFPKLNFNQINYIIDKNLLKDKTDKISLNYDLELIADLIIDFFDLDSDSLNYSFIDFKSVKQFIIDYTEAYIILNYRNQYVFSKTSFYSHITNKNNYELDLSWLKIKEAYENKNYVLQKFSVQLIDEATDDMGAELNKKDIDDESGSKEFRRKYGHIFKETSRLITIKQDSTDEVARYRRLYQSNIDIIDKVKVVKNYPKTNKFINRFIDLINSFYINYFNLKGILKRILNKDDRSSYIDFNLNRPLKLKRSISKLKFIQDFLFSQSYVKFDTNVYADEDDVGKENTASKKYYEPFTFIIPLKYCFGSFSTHEFSYIQDELIKNSEKTLDDLDLSLLFAKEDTKYFKNETGGSYYEL